jgi:hypothetical protein
MMHPPIDYGIYFIKRGMSKKTMRKCFPMVALQGREIAMKINIEL